ncbi:MAG: hypothetical protein AB7T07_08530 [Steroidobacteraceae bacterium]
MKKNQANIESYRHELEEELRNLPKHIAQLRSLSEKAKASSVRDPTKTSAAPSNDFEPIDMAEGVLDALHRKRERLTQVLSSEEALIGDYMQFVAGMVVNIFNELPKIDWDINESDESKEYRRSLIEMFEPLSAQVKAWNDSTIGMGRRIGKPNTLEEIRDSDGELKWAHHYDENGFEDGWMHVEQGEQMHILDEDDNGSLL